MADWIDAALSTLAFWLLAAALLAGLVLAAQGNLPA